MKIPIFQKKMGMGQTENTKKIPAASSDFWHLVLALT